jgi:hypothetical protein
MELGPPWEAGSRSATQELLWNPKIRYHIDKSHPLVPTLKDFNPVHSTPTYICKIHFNIVAYELFVTMGKVWIGEWI